MKWAMKYLVRILAVTLLVLTVACDKSNDSFSLLQGQSTFQQVDSYVPRKLDILWVVDNSGSMQSSQQNLTDNFQSFIQTFQNLGYDFNMGVTVTDAFREKYLNNPPAGHNNLRLLRDGITNDLVPDPYPHSGYRIINQATPNMANVFLINATQETSGSGDERAFESIRDVLSDPANNAFRRPGAFLAVIIVSDEDDFSATTSTYLNNNYSSPNLVPISTYQTYLNGLYGQGNYNINAITIMDNACLNNLNTQFGGRRIGQRYLQFATLTDGARISLCSDFGPSLAQLGQSLVQLASQFKLDREPIPSSIQVIVNGASVPQSAVNGWTYNPVNWTITFHGNAIPPAGATIQILFDPVRPAI